MDNILFFSFDTLFNSSGELYDGFEAILDKYRNNIAVVSHDNTKLSIIKNNYANILHPVARGKCGDCIKSFSKDEHKLIYIGLHEEDLHLAANNKVCLICSNWSTSSPDSKVLKYGIPINSPSQLHDMLEIFFNNHGWYSTQEIDEKTTIFSLMNARTISGPYNRSEAELIRDFENLLKCGRRNYYHILQYYLLGSIATLSELNDVQDWCIFPSSGTILNPEMHDFKESVRYMLNGRKSDPILIRHTPAQKSRPMQTPLRIPCDRHFDTIHLNQVYKNKLRNRTVCVFDDYLTNGTSFEAARNLLVKAGVKKIYCISLGTFCKNYVKQNYDISGDIYAPGYSYSSNPSRTLNQPAYNTAALDDITMIKDILSKP